MQSTFWVYILTNKYHTVFYTGVTNNLERRYWEHIHHITPGFSSKYRTTKLIFFEETNDVRVAIEREKQIKDYSRSKKLKIISSMNSNWVNLAEISHYRSK